jgi:putative FmdB family regulatory protein
MPLYEYKCGACGEVFNKIARLDDTLAVCPCGNVAQRAAFYRDQTVIANPAAAPAGPEADDVTKHGLRERGWGIDDTYDAIRKSVVEDGEGHKRVDTSKITTRGGKR